MRKVLGLLTEDFRLYHDLVAALKARDLPFVSLSFARRIPDTVGAVLTSPAEAGRVRSRHIVAVDDIDSSIAKAIQILKGKSFWSELLVGIDPEIRVRIGHGDPTNRNRILNALARDRLRVEIVDEAGTTHRTPQPDVDAAIDIARTPGRRVQPPFEIRPTPGEVREIQRRSRLESGGLVTISSELAGAVARGDFSLEEAIARARRTQRRSKR